MSKWSSAVQENAIEIHSRFAMGQAFSTIAKDLNLIDREAKELELALRYNPNPLIDNKSAEKLRNELNVLPENVAAWRAEFNAALFKQVWCKSHGECSAEVTALLEQVAAGRQMSKQVSEFTLSILPLLKQDERIIEQKIHGELLPDSAGCGQDFIEGKFINPITDSKELAQQIYEFCPDVVDQGTKTVAALVQELELERRLYLWWD